MDIAASVTDEAGEGVVVVEVRFWHVGVHC